MIRITPFLLLLTMLVSCNSEHANDCFQRAGAMVTEEIILPEFSKIRVNRDISLVLKEGTTQRIQIETGQNLLNDIELTVDDDWLILTNHNACNYVRDYNITKVYITVPDLQEVLSSTQYYIQSDGVLNFSSLRITSEDYNDPSVVALGEIYLDINVERVEIVGNNKTSFYLNGITEELVIYFAAGDGILEGRNLSADKVDIFHRGTNTITVNPRQELKAELRSTGNVISLHEPPNVQIEAYYTGQVIFE